MSDRPHLRIVRSSPESIAPITAEEMTESVSFIVGDQLAENATVYGVEKARAEILLELTDEVRRLGAYRASTETIVKLYALELWLAAARKQEKTA